MLSCFDHVWLWVTLWTTLGSDSPGKKWPGPPPGDLPNPRIKPASCVSPAWADRFFITGTTNATLSFTMRTTTTAYLGLLVCCLLVCLSAAGFSKVPAASLLPALAHTVPLPSRATSLLPNCLSKSCPSLMVQLASIRKLSRHPQGQKAYSWPSVHSIFFLGAVEISRDNSLPP